MKYERRGLIHRKLGRVKHRFFVYQDKKEIIIETKTQRQLKNFGLEMLRSFTTIQDCRAWVTKVYPNAIVQDRVQLQYSGMSPETKLKMSIAKLGDRNPTKRGRPQYVKDKIRATMQGKRCGTESHRFGTTHSAQTKRKMSYSQRLRPSLKWCVDLEGKEWMKDQHFVLPVGWCWGRNTRKWDRI